MLDARQINNLLIGNELVVEIPTKNINHRAFIRICAYRVDSEGNVKYDISKYLNSKMDDLLFLFYKYEISEEYLNTYDEDYGKTNEVRIDGITSIESLETILDDWIDDHSKFVLEWMLM